MIHTWEHSLEIIQKKKTTTNFCVLEEKNDTFKKNPRMKKKVGVERERHEGDTGGDLGPEGVDQVVEVGECVQLQRQMRLVQHRQHTPRRAH